MVKIRCDLFECFDSSSDLAQRLQQRDLLERLDELAAARDGGGGEHLAERDAVQHQARHLRRVLHGAAVSNGVQRLRISACCAS
jgi:hypothetical protein